MLACRPRTRLLTRVFLHRFIDNDLLSVSGDGHHGVTLVVAFLLMSGLWVSGTLVLKTTSPMVSPFGALLSALDDKYVGLAGSMLVTALATVVEWDALGLDRRDAWVLGPLPVPARVIVLAKVQALVLFVGLFAVAMNAVVALLYPPLQAAMLPIGLVGTVWLAAAHLLVSFGACAFGFLAVLAVRETICAVAPTRFAGYIVTVAQFIGVLALTTALLMVAASRPDAEGQLERGGATARVSPPMWFLGAYETVVGPVLRAAPAEAPTRKRQYWTRAENESARLEYLAHADAFARLARSAAVALLALIAACGIGLLVNRPRAYLRIGAPPRAQSRAVRGVKGAVARLLVRHPVGRAGFCFTLRTLKRSASHRASVAGALALGLAAALVTAKTGALLPLSTSTDAVPSPSFLALQLIVMFCLLTVTRVAFAVPCELPSNWVFRFAWNGSWRQYVSGVAWAVRVGLVLPPLVAFVPLNTYVLGARGAAVHFVIGLGASVALSEGLLIGLRKLPFTCSYSPKGTLRTRWPWHLLGFLAFTFGIGRLEALAWSGGWLPTLAAVFAALPLVGVLVRHGMRRRPVAVVFDDPPDAATQTLELGGFAISMPAAHSVTQCVLSPKSDKCAVIRSPCKEQGDHLCVSPGRCRVQRSLVSRAHVGKRAVLEEKSNSRHVAPPGGVNKWALGPHGIGHEVRVRPGLQARFDPLKIAVLGLLEQRDVGSDWRSRRERRTVARPTATTGQANASNDERHCSQATLNWIGCHSPLDSTPIVETFCRRACQ